MGRIVQNTDYFAADNLTGLSRVDEHLAFVEKIAGKYRYTKVSAGNSRPYAGKQPMDWDAISRQIDLIREKKSDRKLNISVIGEFSTGKSTFINALLRRELLASSALQGTTVASTVIDYSEGYEMELEYLDGGPGEQFSYGCFQELQEELERFTTDSSVAQFLKSVNVFLPADILKNDFRIIDTPGTNVTEAWHEDVTVRALKEKSDLSIILTSAEKPVPNTMIGFVKKNLESILPQCVFVVTKLDLIRPRERDRQLAYIKMKLEEELEIRDAVVLPYVSPMVLDSEMSRDDILLRTSLETEQKLIQHTAKQRTLAVTKKLTQLTDEIYNSVSGQMERISRDYENKLALLDRSKKADLSMFVRREKGERLGHFDKAVKELSEDMEQGVYAKVTGACASVVGNLDAKGSLEQLKAYINNSLSGDCRKQAESLLSEADCYCRQIQCIVRDEMKLFQDSFRKIYRSLDIIPLDMSQSKYDFPQKVAIETADIAGAADYIASQLSSNNVANLGGTAAGAAIGTALAPGIGTIIGGFIGFMVAPNKSVSEVREGCKDKLKPQLRNYYNSISEKVISAVDKYVRQMRVCLSDEIDKYLERYRSEVNRQITLENNRRSAINTQVSELKADMESIQNHKRQLESVIVQLNNLGRKEY